MVGIRFTDDEENDCGDDEDEDNDNESDNGNDDELLHCQKPVNSAKICTFIQRYIITSNC